MMENVNTKPLLIQNNKLLSNNPPQQIKTKPISLAHPLNGSYNPPERPVTDDRAGMAVKKK
jgi:hypothetical protein